jgi:xanthine/CO dehydrogenase XdhC/CoxF family maturation factor
LSGHGGVVTDCEDAAVARVSVPEGGAVKHWQETAEILSLLAAEAEAGRRAVLATVVQISGSAYRRPGAKFLVREDGGTSGSVSGGCLEADVRETALRVLRDGTARLLHYDTASDDRTVFGLGLGCNGSVDIFVQPATTPAFLESARRARVALAGEEPIAISTTLEGPLAGDARVSAPGALGADDPLPPGETALHEAQGARVFTEVLRPPPHLVLFGAGDDAIPLARYARDAGFRVAVVDHRPAFLSAARFPAEVRRLELRADDGGARSALPLGGEAYAVVKTHSLAHDREWIRRLLGTRVAYIGVLGPRARIDEILLQLGATADDRVFGPVGLDLGAEGPEQVAMSIVAELLAVRSRRAPGHLRGRRGSIHGG